MAFDFKKEFKEFYMPKDRPEIVEVPSTNYIAVRGEGDPNAEGGAYQRAISILYAVAYTLKMSYKSDYKIEGFFEYVVPPLEGFWWQGGTAGAGYGRKEDFHWISVIRLPDFVTREHFGWAVQTAEKKKRIDCSSAEFLTIHEGLCVQIMHLGPFDEEPKTVALMEEYLEKHGAIYVQTTVANRDDMLKAEKTPEKYKDLVVRVTGFSAQYISLDPVTRKEILSRSYWG